MTITEVEWEWGIEDDETLVEGDSLENSIVLKIDHNKRELEECYDNDPRVVKTDTGYRVGYLLHDENQIDPWTDLGDAVGFIYTSSSRDSRESNQGFQEALGLNSEWRPLVSGDDIIQEIANDLDKDYQELLRHIPVGDEIFEDTQRDNVKLPYRGMWDAILERERKNGNLGDPDRVTLDVYEHGCRVYHVGYNHAFPDRQWDCAYGGAVWVPDKVLRNDEAKGLTGKARRAKMLEWAEQCVEQYNDLESGAVYGVISKDFFADGSEDGDPDECWMYIGSKWAKEELDSRMKWEPKKEMA